MIKTIEFKGSVYPDFQSQGFAARFAFPFAKEVCIGEGYDIGCNRQEWCLPGAIPIDPAMGCQWDAYNLPPEQVDYIFSSHCLEHLANWVDVLDYWKTRLKPGGTLFLYLPHPEQVYWRPWNNRKHIHGMFPDFLRLYLKDAGYENIFMGERDLNHSFAVMAQKKRSGVTFQEAMAAADKGYGIKRPIFVWWWRADLNSQKSLTDIDRAATDWEISDKIKPLQ